jgi:hypothetical protein
LQDWSIEIFSNKFCATDLSKKLNLAFPQRTVNFFAEAICLLSQNHSKLYLLVVDGKVKGASFAFRIFGYDFEVWSPSYLYVEEEYRSISLMFIMSLSRKMSKRVIDISPSEDVKVILRAIKYRQINQGSLMLPVVQGITGLFSDGNIIHCTSPMSEIHMQKRPDLIWFKEEIRGKKSFICVKKTKRYGIPFFILVFFEKDSINFSLKDILFQLFKINPLGVLIVPNFGNLHCRLSMKSSKFHSFSNFDELSETYSILGSEVTEII